MARELERVRRLQKAMDDTKIGYRVGEVAYSMPKTVKESRYTIEVNNRGTETVDVRPEKGKEGYVKQTLIIPTSLQEVVYRIETIDGNPISEGVMLFADVESKRLMLDAGDAYKTGAKQQAKELEARLREIAKKIKFGFETG
ncbi:MAG: hypothetical protein HY516_01295 [Candidatus Aenigmarchaeota archaeon]|nr:hypothetical protein [Candidatus Aenigmarchaeota archaeon]